LNILREVKDEKALKEAAESFGLDAKAEMYKLACNVCR
jgi:hypothetical protein